MSETPRTDEHLRMKEENGHVAVVSREFARQLETELADARAEIDKLRVIKSEQSESLKEAKACIKRYNSELRETRAEIEQLRARNAILERKLGAKK